jgi:hypothetical protein
LCASWTSSYKDCKHQMTWSNCLMPSRKSILKGPCPYVNEGKGRKRMQQTQNNSRQHAQTTMEAAVLLNFTCSDVKMLLTCPAYGSGPCLSHLA